MCFAFASLWDLYLACPSATHMGATEAHAPPACSSSQGRAGLHWIEAGEPKPDSSFLLHQLTGTGTREARHVFCCQHGFPPSLSVVPSHEQHKTQDMTVCPTLPADRVGSYMCAHSIPFWLSQTAIGK